MNRKYNIALAKPWFDGQEAKSAAEVVASRWLISGSKVTRFEKEFAKKIKVKYAVAVGSGSDALLISQQALGVAEGDEVIVPNMTFVSTATSSMYLGARPVFADIELKTYGIDPKNIEKRITKRTKGIIPVHYAGQSCDLSRIIKIAKKHKKEGGRGKKKKKNGGFWKKKECFLFFLKKFPNPFSFPYPSPRCLL